MLSIFKLIVSAFSSILNNISVLIFFFFCLFVLVIDCVGICEYLKRRSIVFSCMGQIPIYRMRIRLDTFFSCCFTKLYV